MTTKPKAQKFRIRRNTTSGENPLVAPSPTAPQADQPAASGSVDSAATVASETSIDAIRAEGLTGRQLRMARRVAQKHGLAVTSDFDAVRQLRTQGIDPFQRANVLELVTPTDAQTDKAASEMAGKQVQPRQAGKAGLPQTQNQGQGRVQLPQTVQTKQQLPSTELGQDNPAERRAGEIRRIQKDIAKRRKRNLLSLFGRLAMFVILPTIAAGYYFFVIATPMYATKSEFVIQSAEAQGAGGLGGLFQGTGLATQTDSTTVQSFMTSREAFQRLDADHGFTEHFQNPNIDAIQRLDPDASNEDAYAVFQDHVLIGYDPTEGILKMEVIAADPQKSQEFAEALISYAESQVDQLTQRLREDQMAGARDSYEAAEARRAEALAELTRIQAETQTADPLAPSAALQQRITNLQLQLDQKNLELASLLDNLRPNEARVNAATAEIGRIEQQISLLRDQLSVGVDGGQSIAAVTARLREAEENYAFQTVLVQQALTQMESAQIEAGRQTRFLSTSVAPIAPDESTYPKAFEDTVLAFLIFSGIYLMISLTASILREQVSS